MLVPVAEENVSPPLNASDVVVAFDGKRYAKVAAPKVAAERQVPLYAKQPLVREMPFPKVEVPLPTTRLREM